MAYAFRMHAINEFGSVVHEFDPWFHYRATEYLVEHGWHAFFHWFDHTSWYPLGRPVATTIYPAMHITAALVHAALGACGQPWKLEDVCCFVPVWGGVVATLFTALLAYECAGRSEAAAAAAGLTMAILPAHLQRSVGGGFDNESVAIPAMAGTFYFWCRAHREPDQTQPICQDDSSRRRSGLPAATAAALSYAYMAAAWGGFVFVANVVALHAGVLLLLVRPPETSEPFPHTHTQQLQCVGTHARDASSHLRGRLDRCPTSPPRRLAQGRRADLERAGTVAFHYRNSRATSQAGAAKVRNY